MRVVLAVAAVLAMVGPSFAGSPCTTHVPPVRYQFEPKIPYTVIYLAEAIMPKFCGITPNGDPEIYGCADTDQRIVFIGRGLPKDWQVCLLTHEKAHLNGWPPNHPA